ncbi:hypothetical protein SAMN05660199_00557 [Klenkia soli]|uniref:Uncharacterized protein n=1 Tax=Klenkia soli TaxID=1052260 RepID=A0A1H0DAH9_9ACTN|nr:hypothetical protein [Klenkia soli]SDN67150.1 hypothetical protein SAMN05660199_00557 [Klenkia soli]
MGKHSAADGAVVHPIVATAMLRRTGAGAPPRPSIGGPRAGHASAGSAVGWPQEPHRGDGIGWPVEPTGPAAPEPTPVGDDGSVLAVLDAAAQGVEAAPVSEPPPARRGGWRRIFGGSGGSPSAA